MKILKDSLKVIIISSVISLSAVFVFAQTGWFEPKVAPPGGNVSMPSIDTSKFLTLDAQGNLNIPGNLNTPGAIAAQSYFVGKLPFTDLFDIDGDGYSPKQGDCNDGDSTIKPGSGALRYDTGEDADCNGIKEYTVKITDDISWWNSIPAVNFCDKGGNLRGFVGYLDSYPCSKWGQFSCLEYSKDITTRTIGNTNRQRICLHNNYDDKTVALGTSGNIGSCGGHGEQKIWACKSGLNICGYGKANPAYWRIWCN
jgi:hypothetical protein